MTVWSESLYPSLKWLNRNWFPRMARQCSNWYSEGKHVLFRPFTHKGGALCSIRLTVASAKTTLYVKQWSVEPPKFSLYM